MKRYYFRYLLCLVSLVFLSKNIHAQQDVSKSLSEYPVRAIRMIVPFPPGGSDTVARLIALRLSDSLGQQIVVDNRAGAAGVIGTQLGAQAPSDGYTILFITASLAITQNKKNISYDLSRDFSPISPIASGPLLVLVHPSVPVKTIGDLIKFTKSKPDQLSYASTGLGSITHLSAELFSSMAGTRMIHVPYRGTGPAQTDLISGNVQVMFSILGPALPHVRNGKLRALGVTSDKRSALALDIPTVDESGVKGYAAATWYGILAPSGTSIGILTKLHNHIVGILANNELTSRLAAIGFETASVYGRQEFGSYIKAETTKWAKLIKGAGIKLD